MQHEAVELLLCLALVLVLSQHRALYKDLLPHLHQSAFRLKSNSRCFEHGADSKCSAGVVLSAVRSFFDFFSCATLDPPFSSFPAEPGASALARSRLKPSIDWRGFRQMVLMTLGAFREGKRINHVASETRQTIHLL